MRAHGISAFMATPVLFILGCSALIDADFDAKTTYPEYFEVGGAAGEKSGGGSGGKSTGGGGSGGESAGGTGSGGENTGGSGGDGSGGDGSGGDGAGGDGAGGDGAGGDGAGGDGAGGDGAGGDGSGGTGGGPGVCDEADACSDDGVVINEIRGQAGSDYIELYNSGEKPADLSGYYVTDGDGSPDSGHLSPIDDGTILMPGGFLYLQEDEGPQTICGIGQDDCQWFGFGISANGDTVFLLTPDLNQLDVVEYPAPGTVDEVLDGETWGRLPDGDALTHLAPTPGGTNVASDVR